MCTKHYRIVSYALFANEGEPEQSADFLARVRENKVDFLDFMVPGAWGTIWGTTWFEVRGRIDRESVKGRAVELVVDLGWKRHRGPGFQAEGLCYRPDGSVIKAVNPDNCWIPLIDANGVANVELDDADMRSNAAIVPYTAKNGDSWIARTAAVGTQDDDANGTDAVADESTIATTCDDGRIILDNGLLRAIIAPDGTVRSLIDLDNGHELVPDGSGIGHYELLRDEPYEWDAWDIQRDAFLSAEGIDDSHVERVTETKRGGATVHVSSTADGVSIDACITLRAKSKSLEFRTKVDWRASERFLKVDIPMAIQADRAQYECQYGMVERPIQKNTRSDEAKYESCTHRFVRVADAGYAAAVVNASTYGSDVSPIHRNTASGPVRGTMIRLSLLSSPLYPDPNTDKGVHEFVWNVVADASMPAVLDEANRLNAAVLPAVPAFDPLAQLNPVDGVMVLDWVKLADDGSGDLILRVYEAVGGEAHARLAVNAALGKATVRECSIMEDARLDAELPAAFADGDPSVARTAQGAMLSLHPFQLATLRVSCGSDGGNTDGNESGSLR